MGGGYDGERVDALEVLVGHRAADLAVPAESSTSGRAVRDGGVAVRRDDRGGR